MKLPAPPAPGEKYRILVVEDDALIVQLMVLHLTSAGFATFSAPDGAEGWQRFQSVEPHLVLTDLVMPRASGQQLCAAIRKESAVPIIVMTGLDSEEAEMESLKIGADDHVPKSANPKLLTARVVANLRRAYRYSAEVEATHAPAAAPAASSNVHTDWPTCQSCGYIGPGDRFRHKDQDEMETLRCPACGSGNVSFPLG